MSTNYYVTEGSLFLVNNPKNLSLEDLAKGIVLNEITKEEFEEYRDGRTYLQYLLERDWVWDCCYNRSNSFDYVLFKNRLYRVVIKDEKSYEWGGDLITRSKNEDNTPNVIDFETFTVDNSENNKEMLQSLLEDKEKYSEE